MTAATTARNTPRGAAAHDQCRDYPVAAAVKIHAGTLVVLTAAGFAKPGEAATGLVTVGRARKSYDNTSGAAGAFRVEVDEGVFPWVNSAAADAITTANVGDRVYVVDDQTVALTNGTGTRSVAGIVRKVDAAGVWTQTGVGVSRALPA